MNSTISSTPLFEPRKGKQCIHSLLNYENREEVIVDQGHRNESVKSKGKRKKRSISRCTLKVSRNRVASSDTL